MRDIYALAAGFYPLVGSISNIEYETHRSSYGIAGSAATIANYYLNGEQPPVTSNLAGNLSIYGRTFGNQPDSIDKEEEIDVLGTLNNANVDEHLKDVFTTVTGDYRTKLIEASRSAKGLLGRSLEEMPVDGYGGTEKMARELNLMRPGTAATPPDYIVKEYKGYKNVGFEVTRQALGTAGHAFQGSVVSRLASDIETINNTHEGSEEDRYEKIAQAGLKRLKERYRSYNQIIAGITNKIKRSADGSVEYLKFEKAMKDIRESDPATEAGKAARTIAYRNVAGQTTNYATNSALLHIQHNVAFINPMFDTYVIDEGAFAEYGPIMNFSGMAQKAYQFRVNEIDYEVLRGIFASDSIMDFTITGTSAAEVAEKKFSAHSNKNMMKHGQVINKGEFIKSIASRPSGTRKLIPSVAGTQADKDFRNVIGKNLEPAAKFIAADALNDPSLIAKLKNKINNQFSQTTIGETRTAWAQPYISAMTFREQAYGSM